MRKKIIILLLFALVLGASALFYIQSDRTKQNVLSQTQEQNNLLEVSLKVGDTIHLLSVPAGSSVYDLMETAAKNSQITFSGKQYPGMGFFVEQINGVRQDSKAGKYWIYYINNQKAQVGVSTYILKPNDVISWNYEASNE